MTTEAAQLQFAAEFTLFLSAVAAIAVTALRPDLLVRRVTPRVVFLVGAAALAVTAFLHGSLLIEDAADPGLLSLRAIGLLAVGVGVVAWDGVPSARVTASVGLVVLAGAEVAVATDNERLADATRGAGALLLAVALLVASRRSIAARVATSAAAVVLLVITALSIALSVVISENVEDEVARRYQARAETESQVFDETARTARTQSGIIATSLAGTRSEDLRTASNPDAPLDEREAAGRAVAEQLDKFLSTGLLSLPTPGPLAAVGPDGTGVASVDAAPVVEVELFGSEAVDRVLRTRRPTEDIAVVGGQALAIGASPITADSEFIGVAVATARLGDLFLEGRISDPSSEEQGVALALVDRRRVYSQAGRQPGLATALTLAGDALREDQRQTAVDGDRFVVAVPLDDGNDTPVMAVIVTVPQERIDATREDLFRLLFIVALGGALVAMVLAGYAGNRIGAGLAQLTAVTDELREGRLSARAKLATEDELGVLASTFNQMAGSLEGLTGDLRRAAEQEAALRARLEGVVGGMGEALIAVDDQGLITDFNAAAEELVGIPARDALGRTMDKICSVRGEDDVDLTARFVRPVVDSWSLPADLRGEGETVPVAVSAGPLRNAGGILTGAVFVLRDMRREREIDQMKTEFIANVSHELRTPLTPVLGYSDLLATRDLDPDRTKHFAGEINSAARKLGRVTDQLVNFATVAAGSLHLQREAVRPKDLLDGLVARWGDKLPASHRLTRRIERRSPRVMIDRRYVDLALDELVDNAVKYSPEGGRIRVTASVHAEGDRRHLQLSVDDQGVGIDPDRREAIFDDFAQGDGSATRRFGGLGIGLSLVSRIVRAHHGELTCTSYTGRGTTVSIFLPLEDEPEPPAPSSNGSRSAGASAETTTSDRSPTEVVEP